MSMTFRTKCLWCGQRFEVAGHAAFEAELNRHRQTCKEPGSFPDLEFLDRRSGRSMKLVYTGEWAGWIFDRHPDGQWVPLRKATDEDLATVNEAVVDAHHAD